MFFKSFTDQNLAQNAYLVGCQRTGDAVIIDPPREFDHILAVAKEEGLRVTAAADTHIHADYISGARQLAVEHGAKLYLSDEGDKNWKYEYTDGIDVELVKEGSTFSVGNIDFEVWHTPGHTPESISFILTDRGGGATGPMGIFTGDFVFVGDVGRPDLLEEAAGIMGTADSGARDMFQSIERFKELPDHLVVWPGHGAGSACGKSLGSVPISTVGYEKQFNWALQFDDEELFVKELLKDQPEAPVYFAEMKKLNKVGPAVLKHEDIDVLSDTASFEAAMVQDNTLVIDTRAAAVVEKNLVPGSINIPFNKSFTNWAGWLAKYDEQLLLIAEEENREKVVIALQSIGLDNIVAIVDPIALEGLTLQSYDTLSVEAFMEEMKAPNTFVVDVRNDAEWHDGHLEEANHLFLGKLRTTEIPAQKKLLIHCQSGVRSAIAATVLKARGFKDVVQLDGGYNALGS
ncbi:rhodanese-like domain-containing protein [Sporosarcina pasteurii]|uniref:Probable polyketide biosynthesis zinc-dependent hydrolase BaeB n=1 Tax=Sporosarcina pasteurii TaxID=1474 RepID=A0A380CFR9_SPOPA|nr:MBL fold metallo-hydrolase [Sporosarcina pasteurii]MDS9473225.1 MBL fold metallo-hydrolase [Sporosarcina pasteurii]QBQ06957.1 MBL fold metallo-hydrolase [Sporosarcina pasteurii]SUJ18058.1 Probable polyketide biosynthesis zinc-dependent hydrolase BaeB [Sporosarcina pasteurii]